MESGAVYGRRPMPARRRFVAALAVLLTLASSMPGLVPPAAAASCSGYSSVSVPPPTIRVLRHATGAVETVDFRAYTKNVLSREWLWYWTGRSLRAGALAVKHYAWYQILHWRGGTNAEGECYDIRDDTRDQVYNPTRPTYDSAAAAVDATWDVRVRRNHTIVPTYYDSGAVDEECGANANGRKMYQWGSQACGLDGLSARAIIKTYYANVRISRPAAPAPSPTPTPTVTPTPEPSPTA